MLCLSRLRTRRRRRGWIVQHTIALAWAHVSLVLERDAGDPHHIADRWLVEITGFRKDKILIGDDLVRRILDHQISRDWNSRSDSSRYVTLTPLGARNARRWVDIYFGNRRLERSCGIRRQHRIADYPEIGHVGVIDGGISRGRIGKLLRHQ